MSIIIDGVEITTEPGNILVDGIPITKVVSDGVDVWVASTLRPFSYIFETLPLVDYQNTFNAPEPGYELMSLSYASDSTTQVQASSIPYLMEMEYEEQGEFNLYKSAYNSEIYSVNIVWVKSHTTIESSVTTTPVTHSIQADEISPTANTILFDSRLSIQGGINTIINRNDTHGNAEVIDNGKHLSYMAGAFPDWKNVSLWASYGSDESFDMYRTQQTVAAEVNPDKTFIAPEGMQFCGYDYYSDETVPFLYTDIPSVLSINADGTEVHMDMATGALDVNIYWIGTPQYVMIGYDSVLEGNSSPLIDNGSGLWSFTVPDDITSITVSVQGAGGSGACAGDYEDPSCGGWAGTYVQSILEVTPGEVLNLTVGLGGVAIPYYGGNGLPGTSSSFEAVLADGGLGGTSFTWDNYGGNGAEAISPYDGAIYHDGTQDGAYGVGGQASAFADGTDGLSYASIVESATRGAGGGGVGDSRDGAMSGAGGNGVVVITWTQSI